MNPGSGDASRSAAPAPVETDRKTLRSALRSRFSAPRETHATGVGRRCTARAAAPPALFSPRSLPLFPSPISLSRSLVGSATLAPLCSASDARRGQSHCGSRPMVCGHRRKSHARSERSVRTRTATPENPCTQRKATVEVPPAIMLEFALALARRGEVDR